MINKTRVERLRVALMVNPIMKINLMGVETGYLGIPSVMDVLPVMTAFDTKLMNDKMDALYVSQVISWTCPMVRRSCLSDLQLRIHEVDRRFF